MTKYKLYFSYENFEDFLTLLDIAEIAKRHSVTFDQDKEVIIGTSHDLINFYQDLDGPAQSFPVTEFLEYIQDFKLV
jgi:hypothetical protein|tara:strand:- start:271 stop:501 length:231 start_codon:yes stop_codon:yes gene_type:complete